ncbi:Aste57867_5840 [Aphanomyces stellatus]|uniref:Aste57867_5840 protein n=1 Tax=Aphanomyces stellatus TaxID=120398 RepID=A0A485KER4_9STRA|nr:hypothetical protein As57867_005826 [Aphanomyces stellatus]VFT82863.1 Aste57867_5840 [Aphanomyces stellatus]
MMLLRVVSARVQAMRWPRAIATYATTKHTIRSSLRKSMSRSGATATPPVALTSSVLPTRIASVDNIALNKALLQARDLSSLLAIFTKQHADFNIVNLTTCYRAMTQFDTQECRPHEKHLLHSFRDVCKKRVPELGPRGLAKLIRCMGCRSASSMNLSIGHDIVAAIAWHVAKQPTIAFRLPDLVLLTGSFAKVEQFDSPVFAAFEVRIARPHDLQMLRPDEVAAVVWSFATAGRHKSHIFDTVASHVVERGLTKFKSHQIALLLKSFAVAGHNESCLFDRFEQCWTTRVVDLKPQDMSVILSSLAKAGRDAAVLREMETQYMEAMGLQRGLQEASGKKRKTKRQAKTKYHGVSSYLHREVSRFLVKLQVHHANEFRTENGYVADILITSKSGTRVIMEVDGPCHFEKRGEETLRSRLKKHELEQLGYRVLSVPYFEWPSDNAIKEKYLAAKLSKVMPLPSLGI